MLESNYARARSFRAVAAWLQPLYLELWTSLSGVNQRLIGAICAYLGIATKLSQSGDFVAEGDRNGRLLALCQEAEASVYVSGPRAATYLDVETFRRAGIDVIWMDYENYPEYPQLWGSFEPQVSILDLLFNCGVDSGRFMKRISP